MGLWETLRTLLKSSEGSTTQLVPKNGGKHSIVFFGTFFFLDIRDSKQIFNIWIPKLIKMCIMEQPQKYINHLCVEQHKLVVTNVGAMFQMHNIAIT